MLVRPHPKTPGVAVRNVPDAVAKSKAGWAQERRIPGEFELSILRLHCLPIPSE
jgi:hypothetical protein